MLSEAQAKRRIMELSILRNTYLLQVVGDLNLARKDLGYDLHRVSNIGSRNSPAAGPARGAPSHVPLSLRPNSLAFPPWRRWPASHSGRVRGRADVRPAAGFSMDRAYRRLGRAGKSLAVRRQRAPVPGRRGAGARSLRPAAAGPPARSRRAFSERIRREPLKYAACGRRTAPTARLPWHSQPRG